MNNSFCVGYPFHSECPEAWRSHDHGRFGQSSPGALAVDSSSVYWTNSNSIMKVSIGGGAPVLAPGGLLVVEDSAQLAESSVLAQSLAKFAHEFHEPFYEDYLRDDIAALLGEAGFRVESVTPAFLSKVVVARA
jgi:hypothetical protein